MYNTHISWILYILYPANIYLANLDYSLQLICIDWNQQTEILRYGYREYCH